jgi:hypothetical protein
MTTGGATASGSGAGGGAGGIAATTGGVGCGGRASAAFAAAGAGGDGRGIAATGGGGGGTVASGSGAGGDAGTGGGGDGSDSAGCDSGDANGFGFGTLGPLALPESNSMVTSAGGGRSSGTGGCRGPSRNASSTAACSSTDAATNQRGLRRGRLSNAARGRFSASPLGTGRPRRCGRSGWTGPPDYGVARSRGREGGSAATTESRAAVSRRGVFVQR